MPRPSTSRLGYAWTLAGGLKIEPQLQYTKTNVDNLDVLRPRQRHDLQPTTAAIPAAAAWVWRSARASATPTPAGCGPRTRPCRRCASSMARTTTRSTTPSSARPTVEGTSALLELGFNARHQNLSIYGGLNWQDGGAIEQLLRRPAGRALHLRWRGPGAGAGGGGPGQDLRGPG